MHIKFWGTSDAHGVPRMMCDCKVCASENVFNKRTRSSLYVTFNNMRKALLDVGPDFRNQFLKFANKKIPDDILITHTHNDHIAGIGDLVDLCFWNRADCRIVAPFDVIEEIKLRFPYITKRKGLSFIPTDHYVIENYDIRFIKMNHGFNGYSYGITFKSNNHFTLGYYPDTFNLTKEQLNTMESMDLVVLGTSYWKEDAPMTSRSVYDVQEGIEIKLNLNIKNMILTHLSHDIDFEFSNLLPNNVHLAYDGFEVFINEGDKNEIQIYG